ncbi:MAG: hypothetical protein RLZZ292_659 [Bacteroidota bacterium]
MLLSSIFTFNACKKDELALQDKKTETKAAQTLKGFRQYAWSPKEQSFFSIAPRASQSKSFRSDEELIYHPLVKKAYNEIARQNEQEHFVEGIMTKVGVPIWDKSFVHYNSGTKDNLVVIPLAFEKEKQLTGFLALTEEMKNGNKRYIVNTMSRQDLLDTKTGNYKQKAFYTKKMLQYEKEVLGTTDEVLREANCHYKTNENEEANNLNPAPCEWTIIELCDDDRLQQQWIGGHPPKYHPTEGDHDGDGILNKDDEDYKKLIEQIGDDDQDGIPNNIDKEWLNDNIPIGDHDHDGISNALDSDWVIWYALYGDHDNDGVKNKDDQDWHDFEIRYPYWNYSLYDWVVEHPGDKDNFDDWWNTNNDNGWPDNPADWWADNNYWETLKYEWTYDDPDKGFIYDYHDDVYYGDCPFGGGKIASNNSSHSISTQTGAMRDVRCEWFYAIDCPNIPNKWWHGFDLVVPCPECGGGSFDPETEKWSRLDEFIRRYHLDPSLIDFLHDNIATDCSPSSPPIYYEDCVKAAFIDHLKVKFGLDKQQTSALTSLLNTYTSERFQDILNLANNPAQLDAIKMFLTKIGNDSSLIQGLEANPPSLNIGNPVDVNNPLCPKSFTFPLNNSVDGLTKGGLKNVAVSFTTPNGTTLSVSIAYLYIYIQNDIAMLSGSPGSLFANAINNATNNIQNQITQGMIPSTIGQFGLKALYMTAIGQALQTLGLSFAGGSGGTTTSSTIKSDVKFINQVSAASINMSNGQPAQVVNWNTAITTIGCP